MLYHFIRIMAITAVRTFFNKISGKNMEHIPKDVPVIFAANHPNTMIDPMIIGYTCPRQLHFFAKSTIFKHPIASWFLHRIKIIPIIRKQDHPNLMDKNEDAFEKGYDILRSNGAFLIFPEGVSTGERQLSKIKTGAARIGFGAEVHHNWQLGVQVIPVGLNYTDAIKFRSDVSTRFGQPIILNEFKDQFERDEKEAVHLVTEQLEVALSKLTIDLKDLEMKEIVSALETIYKQELAVDLGLEIQDKSDDFSVTKGLTNAVKWYFEHSPKKVEKFKLMLKRYQTFLGRLKIKDEYLDPASGSISFWERLKAISYLVFLFPIYLYGLINNVIPYKFPRWYAKHTARQRSEIAPWKMISGIGIFLIYYPIEIIIFASISGSFIWTAIYAISLIPSGNFVLNYVQRFDNYRQHLRFISVFYKKRTLIYELINQRTEIIDFLNICKKEYMSTVGLEAEK